MIFSYNNNVKRLGGALLASSILLTSAAGLAGCGPKDKNNNGIEDDEEMREDLPDFVPPDVDTEGMEPVTPPSETPKQDNEGENETTPEPPSSPEVNTSIITEAKEAKGDEFFEDAAFMGNSLMDGFRLYSGIKTCDYYAGTSATIVSATTNKNIVLDNGNYGTYVEGLTQKQYGKIYILLGINEIYLEPESFKEMYGGMIDSILASQKDCDLYILGLTPVSYAKSSSHDLFNMPRIKLYNEALMALAQEKGCYYLDLVSVLAGDDGYLPADKTTDGVHFSPDLYKVWADYLKTHYAE